jgi:NAD(P)H-hydrate repair Nnr-like enzyme with NAD(P)H-hydrate dehydratase domain
VRLLEEVIPLVPKRTPVVLDAYGFTVLPQVDPGVRASLSGRLVANCNPGELAMVVGREDLEAEDVPEPALEVAADLGAVLSCHGWLVSDEGGVWQVTSGDTGLGTSGSGDVLAGALAGLLSRGAERRHAAVWAAYVHAAAGDNLAARFGRIGFLASDLLPELPQVLSALRGD